MIPSRHSRLPRHGRPRLSLRTFGCGKSGSSTAHCSSVRMLRMRFAILQRKPHLGKKYKCHFGRFMKLLLGHEVRVTLYQSMSSGWRSITLCSDDN